MPGINHSKLDFFKCKLVQVESTKLRTRCRLEIYRNQSNLVIYTIISFNIILCVFVPFQHRFIFFSKT
jgi:hypothetical protein